jgi:small subunit ribosomal protein S20
LANIKSQIKRIRTSERQTERNKPVRSELKTYITEVRTNAAAGNKEATKESLAKAIKRLDSAASKGVIHPNNAANKKSALTKLYNNL